MQSEIFLRLMSNQVKIMGKFKNQNSSVLVRYVNFFVKKLRENNIKVARFHWSRNTRDSCPLNFFSTIF